VETFSELLHDRSLSPALNTLVPAQGEWLQALIENRRLMAFAGVMLALALLVTVLN
jgi:hypothetical protein